MVGSLINQCWWDCSGCACCCCCWLVVWWGLLCEGGHGGPEGGSMPKVEPWRSMPEWFISSYSCARVDRIVEMLIDCVHPGCGLDLKTAERCPSALRCRWCNKWIWTRIWVLRDTRRIVSRRLRVSWHMRIYEHWTGTITGRSHLRVAYWSVRWYWSRRGHTGSMSLI